MSTERRQRIKNYLLRLLTSQSSRLWGYLPAAERIKTAIVEEIISPKVLDNPLRLAPTKYRLYLHPNTVSRIPHLAHLQDELAIAIHAVGNAMGVKFAILPQTGIEVSKEISEDDFSLESEFYEPAILNTLPLTATTKDVPKDAYFIIQSTKIFPLKTPIVHIGRRADNDLVINDPRVSRLHAQLRATGGRYRIIDLNSTGGTFINGKRITNTILYPGDVISLAGVSMLYGQRTTRPLTPAGPTSPLQANNNTAPTETIMFDPNQTSSSASDEGREK